jgi:hypothetical protein
VAGAVAAVACGADRAGLPASRPALAPATITYAFLGNPVFLQMNQDAAREFEGAFPGVKLELSYLPTGMYDKIQNLYAGGSSPDVWEPDAARFPAWAARRAFADVGPLARRDQEQAVSQPPAGALGSPTQDGHLVPEGQQCNRRCPRRRGADQRESQEPADEGGDAADDHRASLPAPAPSCLPALPAGWVFGSHTT